MRIFLTLIATCCFCSDHIERYLSFIQSYPLGPSGNHLSGEIQIVLDPNEISRIEKLSMERLASKGHFEKEAQEFSQVGIIAEDQYWIWVRDAVIFPSGLEGTYNRLLWRAHLDGPPASVIVPVFPDERIGVIVTYRHATRSWHVQLPAGLRKSGETPEMTAKRELLEETGLEAKTLMYLGAVAPDSGLSPSKIPVFLAHIDKTQLSRPDETEAIEKLVLLDLKDLEKAINSGELEVMIRGKMQKVPCNDPTLCYALWRMKNV